MSNTRSEADKKLLNVAHELSELLVGHINHGKKLES